MNPSFRPRHPRQFTSDLNSGQAGRFPPLPWAIFPILALIPISASAATKTWDGAAANGNWSDAANWNADGVPTSSDAVLLNNATLNPVPQINAQNGANCGTLTIDGLVNGTFLNYGGSTPLVTNLYGASVNAANTGPLINITANAPATVTANKVNFQLRTNGELFVAAAKTLTLSNSFFSQNGTRSLTKSGAGTVQFSGSGSEVTFTGGLNMAQGTWNAGTDTLDLPTSGIITFTNATGVAATITSTNSHSIGGLAGGNSNSIFSATGAAGLTITGSAATTFGGRIQSATKLTYAGTGSLTLTASNPFTGTTQVNSGSLVLGAAGTLGGTPSVGIASGATFNVSALAAGFTVGNGKSLSGGGSVIGKLTAASGATITPGLGQVGTLTVSNGFTLAAGAALAMEINSAASYDVLALTGGNVSLAGNLNASLGYAAAINDTLFLVRNNGSGTTTGTLSGVGDGGKLDIGGKWWRVSFTSDFGGSGFAVGGSGNDVAIRRIDDPTPTAVALGISGPTETASVQLQLTWADNATGETGYRVYRLLVDGSLELVATLPAGSTGFSAAGSNQSTHTYAVQAFNGSGTIGDLVFTTPLTAGTTYEFRHDAMLDWVATTVPNLTQFGSGPHRIGSTGFFHAGARFMRGETATGVSYVTAAIEDASTANSNAGFSMWPGMDAWMRWNHLFPQSLKDRYQQVYTTSDLYDNGSTPNQRFMITAASYLANSVWGGAVNSVSSAAYGTGDPSGKAHVVNEIERVPFRGFAEHDAKNYLLVTLSPMETLAQLAPDADVRNKARMVNDWGIANAAGYWFNGHWGVSATRYATGGRQNLPDDTATLWWLLFGGPGSGVNDSHTNLPFLTPGFPGMLPELESASRDRRSSYRRRSFATRGVNGIDAAYFKQSWTTPRHTLWSQVEGTVTFNADNSINLVDVDSDYIQDGYQGERWALAWDSPPGNDAKLRITTPTTYGTTTDGISIWEDTLQHEDTMIAVYNMPVGGGGSTGNNGVWANELLKGHIPAGWQAITDEAATSGRIFLHYDSVLVALYLNRTFSWATDFTVNGVNKAALAIETAEVDEFTQSTAAARLAAFRAAVLANAPDTSGMGNSAPRFVYTNRHGHTLDLTFGLAGKIDGITVDYQSWPMLEDPWMYQAQNGHLHIFGPNRVVTSNYYNWSQSINHQPATTSAPTIPATTGTPVDVDLAARAADTETPDNQLHFTVSNPSNGSVTLLPDGKTARFTPTASGPAAFDFTTRDRGIHPRIVWHYDFESTTTADASGQNRNASQALLGTGTAALQADTPAPLGANSTKSLRLTEASPNAAKLTRLVTRTNLEMSNGSWTFATWFKRASRTTDDFIFYIGASDGFSGGGDELQLRAPANSDALRLEHYNTGNIADLAIFSTGTAVQNVWHHAAVTFEKTADNTGTVRLYLNGTQVGTPTTMTWALQQNLSVVLGGVTSNNTAIATRYFNGWLDDAALFRGAMTASEVANLAKQSVATFSGLSASASVPISVSSNQQTWLQTHFGPTPGPDAGDLADSNRDGEVNLIEFATGQNPYAKTRAISGPAATNPTLEMIFPRSHAAIRDGFTFAVEWSESIAPGSWSREGVTEQILNDDGLTQTVRARVAPGLGRRFLHLEVTKP